MLRPLFSTRHTHQLSHPGAELATVQAAGAHGVQHLPRMHFLTQTTEEGWCVETGNFSACVKNCRITEEEAVEGEAGGRDGGEGDREGDPQ